MDPITAAIVSALTAGAIAGITEAGKNAIADAYQTLKTLLKQKFGDKSNIVTSANMLQENPQSTSRQGVLAEEIEKAQANKDPELLKAAQALTDLIEEQPGGNQQIQNVIGNFNASVLGSGSATVNIYRPPEESKGR